ncbi:uncharacterized protein FFMR_05549 [Fusarium fujikuroi]|nr:uncharacterized protein FFC1_13671 [Fusarium fujikuroi]SCO39172.1 uncharacterized protein FFMR_05549 [Fusarium fujikuroi]
MFSYKTTPALELFELKRVNTQRAENIGGDMDLSMAHEILNDYMLDYSRVPRRSLNRNFSIGVAAWVAKIPTSRMVKKNMEMAVGKMEHSGEKAEAAACFVEREVHTCR